MQCSAGQIKAIITIKLTVSITGNRNLISYSITLLGLETDRAGDATTSVSGLLREVARIHHIPLS